MNSETSAAGGRPGSAYAFPLVTAFLFTVSIASSQSPSTRVKLDIRTGTVEVKGGVATIDIPDGWAYLDHREARLVIEKVWGFPAREATLGLILPPNDTPWGGIWISYTEIGHLDDKNVDLDPSGLAEQIREKEFLVNTKRKKQGKPTIELVGWTDPPHYDSTTKKLRWGRSVLLDGQPAQRYDMRVLGAEGILAMVAIVQTADTALVVPGARRVLAGTRLSAALSYSRYDPKVHKEYKTKVANLIRGNRQRLPVELFRVVLRPVIAVAVLVIALFFTRRSRRRSTNSLRSRGVPTPG